jgi:hypothetical protein
LFFDLADTGNELSVKTSSGEAFSAQIGSDGSVETTFALPIGAKSLSVSECWRVSDEACCGS